MFVAHASRPLLPAEKPAVTAASVLAAAALSLLIATSFTAPAAVAPQAAVPAEAPGAAVPALYSAALPAEPAAPSPALRRRSDWVSAHRTQGAFDLPARDLEGLPFSYLVRRHAEGGGRQDILSWGTDQGVQLKIVLYRPGQEPTVPVRAPAVVRDLGAVAGLGLDTLNPAGLLSTKFGDLPLMEATVHAEGRPRQCLAAGDFFPGTGILLAGFACSPGAELVDRKRLACYLDRLVMLSAGGSEALAAFFARSELNRSDLCTEMAFRPTAATRRPDWLSLAHGPPLRGRLAGR